MREHQLLVVSVLCIIAHRALLGPTGATCGDKDGAGNSVIAVSNDDCGTGFIYDSTAAAVRCAGAVCDVRSDPDKAACCVEQATWGDADGEGDLTLS
eukprot:SAG31_NODE_26928_length_434_cov_0.641791_2_plen_96_part_01